MTTSTLMVVVFWAITALVSGFGAYFGSYFKRKGENLATHEDISKLVDQVRAVTTTTKEIEAKIEGEVWDKQRQWELKRDAVSAVIEAVNQTYDSLKSIGATLRSQEHSNYPEKFQEQVNEGWRKWSSSIDNFELRRVLALLVCDRGLDNALTTMRDNMKEVAHVLEQGKLYLYEGQLSKIKNDFALVLYAARHEIGMDWKSLKPQSSESSAPQASE